MRAELVSIGTELLLGQIVDTNAAYLAAKLAEIGVGVYFKSTVGDNLERMQAVLQQALARSEAVICTGGLGPTADDLTSQALAAVTGTQLVLHQPSLDHIRQLFHSRRLPLLESHRKQAMIPAGALPLPNPVGSAPGYLLEHEGKLLVAMPGVPSEMRAMAEATLLPYLAARVGGETVIKSRVLKFAGIGESMLEERTRDLFATWENPTLAYLAKAGEAHLRITARADSRARAEQMIGELEREVLARLGEACFGADDQTLEGAVGGLLRERGLSLATAESCTGGMLGDRITSIPGSSAYYQGGVVAYSNRLKVELLGVPEPTIAEHGAVSAETALAMAQGARRCLGADLAVAITGVAGPGGGTPAKPVGLVYVALDDGAAAAAHDHQFGGSRQEIKLRSTQAALTMLWQRLKRQ